MNYFWLIAICCLTLTEVSRSQNVNLSFPANFTIGAATSSYQIEGSKNGDKGESAWDRFAAAHPIYIEDRSSGDIACDSYNKYEEDVQWVKDIGLDFYRFSISWPRILPNGFRDTISDEGLQYYKNLTEALLANNITPIVTLYQWDHSQIFEELGGWGSEMMVEWFADYVRVIFKELGPMVKTFVTINDPKGLCEGGYNGKRRAPGKVFENMGQYICAHNILKAHATAYHIYDEEFRPTQQGEIGITHNCSGWVAGANTSDASIEQFFLFECGWIMHPIYIGDYPEIMKTRIDMISELEGWPFSRLPKFTDKWIEYIKGTADFFGLNHYTSIMPVFDSDEELGVYNIDSGVISVADASWSTTSASVYVVPDGLSNLLRMIRDQYDNPPVYIFENGFANTNGVDDYERIDSYHQYLTALLTTIYEDGCDVRKFTIWSLLDSYEWELGYTQPYGIISVDFNDDNRTRTAKQSAVWWQEVLSTRQLQDVPTNNSTR